MFIFISVAYQLLASATFVSYHVYFVLSTSFFDLFSLFQRRLLKQTFILLMFCCRVQQPWIIYTRIWQKSTLFLYFFQKWHVTLFAYKKSMVFVHLAQRHAFFITSANKQPPQDISWGGYHNSYLLNNSIPAFTLAIVSSLPMISMISVAPAGVICFPETAVLIGQSA